jgi:dTDP-4-amino-4,6-dideoxygalactose transaminase
MERSFTRIGDESVGTLDPHQRSTGNLPEESEGDTYNQFTIAVPKRDSFRSFLLKNGIHTSVYYPLALHLQPVFQELGYQEEDFPVSEKFTREVISLPIFPQLSETEQNFVIGKAQDFLSRKGRR